MKLYDTNENISFTRKELIRYGYIILFTIICMMLFKNINNSMVKGDTTVYQWSTYQISQSSDDAHLYYGKDIDLTRYHVYIQNAIYDNQAGFRFQNVVKYSNATINSAILSFYVDSSIYEDTQVTIYGIKGNPLTFTNTTDMLITKEIIADHVNIDAGDFIKDTWNNITVTDIVAKIVSTSWNDGDNIGFKILSSPDNYAKVVSYDGNSSLSAKLYIRIKYIIEDEKEGDYEITYRDFDIYYIKTRSWEFADDLPSSGFALGGGSEGTISSLSDGWGFTDCDRYADKYYYKSISESTFHYLFLLNLTRVDDVIQTPYKYYKYQALQWIEGTPSCWADLGSKPAISVYISGTGIGNPNEYQLWLKADNPDHQSGQYIGHVDNSYMVEVQRTTGWFNMSVYTYPGIIPLGNYSCWVGSGYTYTNLMTVAGINKNDENTEKYSGKVIRDFTRGKPGMGDLIFNIYDEDGNQVNGNFTSIEDAQNYIDNYLENILIDKLYAPLGTYMIGMFGIVGIIVMPISIILIISSIQHGDLSNSFRWIVMFFVGLTMAIAWLWG